MRFHTILACASSIALVVGSPALAQGKKDRAREAVAAAQAKVDAAANIGVAGETPRLLAEAQAALRTAKEDLAGDRKDKAIADANSASLLADQAIGESQKMKGERERADKAAADASAADAQRQAADAQARAAASAADAAAARNAPPVIIAAPAPAPAPTTTITTETSAPAPVVKVVPKKRVVTRRVVRKAPVTAAAKVTTKTTVTTKAN